MARGTYALILIASFWCGSAWAVNCGTSVPGQFRYNVTSSSLEYCAGPAWISSKVSTTNLSCTVADSARVRYTNGEVGFCDGYYWYSTKGSLLTTCTSTDAGKISWSGTVLRFCDGSNWYSMTNPQSTAGAFVLTNGTYTGNLGGLAGAGTTCFKEVTNYDWYDKVHRGVISPWRVSPWLCDGSSCNGLANSTAYTYAAANKASSGGTSFTSTAAGVGPNAAGNWSAAGYTGTTGAVWSGRTSTSATLWGTTSGASHCTGWSTTTGTGLAGTLASSGTTRWNNASPNCTTSGRLFCIVAPADTIKPDPYTFTDVTGASASTTYNSNIVAIGGFSGSVNVGIFSLGTAKFRVCADATCSAAPSFVTATTTITAGQYLQLQVTTGSQAGAIAAVTAYVGNSSANWNVTVSGLAGYFLQAYNEPATGQMFTLGGLDGANDQCYQKAVRYDWKGKANAGTLTRGRVRAFLCDDQACNNMTPGTNYYFGVMNNTTPGGASFTTNSSGQGPGDAANWSTSTYFSTSNVVPSNRGAGTNTYWSLDPRVTSGGSCSNWTTGWDTYYRGATNATDLTRWTGDNGGAGSGYCAQYNQIFCFIDPVLAPTSMSFVAQTGLDPLTTYASNIVAMTGLSSSAAVQVRGAGSPQYRICSDSGCSSVVTNWTNSGGAITASQFLQLRSTTTALPGTKQTVSATVGNLTATWNLTNEATARTGYFVLSSSTHNGSFGGLSGLNAFCLTELNGSSWLGKGSAPALTSTNVKAYACDSNTCNLPTGSATYAFAKAGSTTIGGATFSTDSTGNFPGDNAKWSDTTRFGSSITYFNGLQYGPGDNYSPQVGDSNTCNDWSNATTSYSANTGVTNATDANRFSSGSGTCDGTVQYICFVHPGATPSAFSFTDQTGVGVSSTVTSNIVQISGQTYEAAATASGTGAQVRVCADSACATVAKDWRTAAFVAPGQYLQVRATSSPAQTTATTVVVKVGSASTTWTMTTGNFGLLELKSMEPNGGLATGGNTITLTGINFASGITAAINGVPCTTSTYVSATSMTCVVPSGGTGVFAQVDVSVTNPGPTTFTLSASYFYLGAPRSWYSADVGITQSGGLVSAWADRSGNGNTLTQATSGSRPSFVSSSATFNSRPTVNFAGSQFFSFTQMSVTNNIAGATWITAISVQDLNPYMFFAYSTPSDNEYLNGSVNYGLGPDLSASPGMVCTYGARTDVAGQALSGGSFTANTAFLVSSVTDFTNRGQSLYVDRSQVATTSVFSTAGSTPAVNASSTYTYLGGGDGYTLNGKIPEFFIYTSALSNANRQIVENYLKSRYNTP